MLSSAGVAAYRPLLNKNPSQYPLLLSLIYSWPSFTHHTAEPPNVFRILSTPIDHCFDVTRGCNYRCAECLRGQASLLALRGFTQVGLGASLLAWRKDAWISSWAALRWPVQ